MKNSPKFAALVAVTIFVSSITSCNEKAKESTETAVESTFNLSTAKGEIEAVCKEFKTFIAAEDSIGLSNLYTQDAKFMMTGAPAISGRENIQSTFSGIIRSGISAADLRTIEVWGTEAFVTEEGEYSLFVGETEVDKGKYLVLWKKVDGKWKFFRDIFNSNLPTE
jgi:ketosteroid isomerase-like protein